MAVMIYTLNSNNNPLKCIIKQLYYGHLRKKFFKTIYLFIFYLLTYLSSNMYVIVWLTMQCRLVCKWEEHFTSEALLTPTPICKLTEQKVNRFSLCLCYWDKLCIQLLIHKLNLKKILIFGLIKGYVNTSSLVESYLIGKSHPWIFKFLFCVFTLFYVYWALTFMFHW